MRQEVEGERFRHAVFVRRLGAQGQGRVLHIYLEGDGKPLFDRRVPRADSGPRTPLALELMALDPAPSALLGRPCHHGETDAGCPDAGAQGRFSPAVVESLARAAARLATGYEGVALIGYSGGAALALELACRLPQARAVVTIAGVVDPADWARRHGLPPLAAGPAPVCRAELHLVGGEDVVAPAEWLARGGEIRRYEAFDHSCCWREAWPDALDWLRWKGGG